MNQIKALLASHPQFQSMDKAHHELLAECGKEVSFKSGDFIFRQGEPASHFYIITEGKVVLESHEHGYEDTPVENIGPNEMLGWSWLFAPFVWHFQARTLTDVKAIAFDGAHMLVACETNPELGYDLMRRITQVVIKRLVASRQRHLEAERRFKDHIRAA